MEDRPCGHGELIPALKAIELVATLGRLRNPLAFASRALATVRPFEFFKVASALTFVSLEFFHEFN
jgi:hypothetical protein